MPGEITLLLGANGAGKSTLLRCLLGVTDFEGDIRVAGRDPLRDGRAVRSLVGYMPQSGGLHLDLTVDDTMRLYADIRARAARSLRSAARGSRPRRTTRRHWSAISPAACASGSGFALALLTDPQILVLDEPSASLDAGEPAVAGGAAARRGGRRPHRPGVHARGPGAARRRASPHRPRGRPRHARTTPDVAVARRLYAAAPGRPGTAAGSVQPVISKELTGRGRQPLADRLRGGARRARARRHRDGARQHVRAWRCRHSAGRPRR